MTRSGWVLLLCVVSSGCGERSGAAPGSSSARSKGSAAPAAPAPGDGVLELAKQALACPWEGSGFEKDCIEWEEWEGSALIRDGKADATLVGLLADSGEKARWLGAWSLSSRGAVYVSDRALAEQVLHAAEVERSKAVARLAGAAAGKVHLAQVGLLDRGKALAKGAAALKEARLGFIEAAQAANREALFDVTMALAKGDPDVEVRSAAAGAFWGGTPVGKEKEVCALWLSLAREGSEELAARSAHHAAAFPFGGGCKGEWEALLGEVERRGRGGKAQDKMWGAAPGEVFEQKGASAALKARAAAAARAVAGNAANGEAARQAAEALVKRGK